MKQFKMSLQLKHKDLYDIFCSKSKYVRAGNFYYIYFNGKDLSADNPYELFDKVKIAYEQYKNSN